MRVREGCGRAPRSTLLLLLGAAPALCFPHPAKSILITFIRNMRAQAVTALAAALLSGLGGASTLTPPVLPLIVRNPYLSTWLADAREEPWSKWPMFWTGQSVC